MFLIDNPKKELLLEAKTKYRKQNMGVINFSLMMNIWIQFFQTRNLIIRSPKENKICHNMIVIEAPKVVIYHPLYYTLKNHIKDTIYVVTRWKVYAQIMKL